MNEDEASAVEAVYAALADADRARLRLLLHPYLHWTGADGVTIRGRTNVLGLLDDRAVPPEQPTTVELPDGQIHRWPRE